MKGEQLTLKALVAWNWIPAVFAVVVFLWNVSSAAHVVRWIDMLFAGLIAYATYMFVGFVMVAWVFVWEFAGSPLLRHLRMNPVRTVAMSLLSILVLFLVGWCGALVGLGGGDTHCEVEPRGGVYCE
jgi:hypothetical protein